MATFAAPDSLAQLVEHNTFNVGVLGSSPSGITKKTVIRRSFFCLILSLLLHCTAQLDKFDSNRSLVL